VNRRVRDMKAIALFIENRVSETSTGVCWRNIALFFAMCVLLVMFGCASMEEMTGFGSASKTAQLRKGMTYEQVEALLGQPKSSTTAKGQLVVRWDLHEYGKGWVFYDMVFDPDKKTLVSWSENEEAYQAHQKKWSSILAPLGGASGTTPGQGGPSPAGPSDPALMRQMSATYYSFSSAGYGYTASTERRVILCPDGRYYSGSESGYSGGAGTAGAWGSASQGKGQGTWRIVGNTQEGTLTTISADGTPTEYRYRSCGQGCYYFGNTKFAVEGPARCP
jgi:hypothetical protein